MMDQQVAAGPEGGDNGKSGFSDAWDELARDEAGQGGNAPPEAGDRHEQGSGQGAATVQGQPGSAPDAGEGRQTSDAARPAGSEITDDVWADATPAQLEARAALEERARQAENTARSHGGRLSVVQRQLNELQAHKATQPAPGGDAATGAGGTEAGASEEELKRVAEEYGEVAAPILKEISRLTSHIQRLEGDAGRRNELEQAQAALAEQERLAGEERALADSHPDWGDVVKSRDFADWALAQPRFVQEALIRNGSGIVDGFEASKILSDFKRDKGLPGDSPDPLAARRDRQLEGSRQVPTRTGTTPAATGKGNTFDQEWERLQAEDNRNRAPAR